MKKDYTFKINEYKCELCDDEWLYLDNEKCNYPVGYVCKCANCDRVIMLPSTVLVSTIKEHLREVRRNENNI